VAGARSHSLAERALGAIPDFNTARIVSRLSDGPSNASFLVEQGGGQYVLRLDKPGARQLGLDRVQEMRINEAVATAGLSPEPLFFDPAKGIYLRRFEPGRTWTAADLDCPENPERLAGMLRTLHSLQPVGAAFDPLAAARRYAAQLGSEEARRTLRACETLMAQISFHPESAALCHNDLLCQNILEGNKLMLIDWEYAGIGDPYFDLAVVVRHHGQDPSWANGFLQAYLQRPAASGEIEHLCLQCRFYGHLLNLWNQINP
jgi:thiamine kinase